VLLLWPWGLWSQEAFVFVDPETVVFHHDKEMVVRVEMRVRDMEQPLLICPTTEKACVALWALSRICPALNSPTLPSLNESLPFYDRLYHPKVRNS
jgi:hypothetical protein